VPPQLDALLHTMCTLMCKQSTTALESLHVPTKALIALILFREHTLNRLEGDIEAACKNLLLMHPNNQHVIDRCIQAQRIARDYERVGDELKKIASMSLAIAAEHRFDINALKPLRFIACEANRVLHVAVAALESANHDAIDTVFALDKAIDNAMPAVMDEIEALIVHTPTLARIGIDAAFIAKAWERVGDHAKNIAQQIRASDAGRSLALDRAAERLAPEVF
jgi:phosphate transport system protein